MDSVGAGAGETVLILDEGNSARQVLEYADAPVRAVIVGHRRRQRAIASGAGMERIETMKTAKLYWIPSVSSSR